MYALRYRALVSGWWIDGCYKDFGYNDDLLKPYFDTARAGNGRIDARGICTRRS
jgi:hypothetical protein